MEDRHLDKTLHELVVQGGEPTKSLLGFRSGSALGSDKGNMDLGPPPAPSHRPLRS